jgi:hypothetical protein
MYWGGWECLGLSLATKLGLHLVTFTHFTNIFTSFPTIGTSRTMYGHEGTSF